MTVRPEPDVIPRYPDTPREDHDEIRFGIPVSDPYRWLEDPSDPRTVRWAEQQHRMARSTLDALPHRARWRSALRRASAVTETGPPRWRGGRAFFLQQRPGDRQPVLRLADQDAAPRVLLDTGPLVLDEWAPSPDGRRLAYRASAGDEESSVFVLDVDSGALLDGPIDGCRNSPLVWLPDGDALCYVRRTSSGPSHRRVWRHAVGTHPDTDTLLFGDGQPPLSYYTLDVSADGHRLVVGRRDGADPDARVFLVDLTDSSVREVAVAPRTRAFFAGNDLCLLADELLVCEPSGRRRTVVPAEPGRPLVDAAVFDDGRAVAVRLVAARVRVTWYDAEGWATGHLAVEAGSADRLSVRGDRVWMGWTSFVTPATVLTARVGDARPTVWPLSFQPERAPATVTDRWYRSADGTTVHAFVCATRAAPAAALLTAYGGFGVALTPRYSPELVAWLQAGGAFVVANVRGGGEYGPEWHDAARRGRKAVTFDDLAAVAAGLVADGTCPAGHLAISGSSNGGLTVAAAMTREPDRYAAVACLAPLLDMARYEHSGLGPVWRSEYGSAADAEGLTTLLGYSPYHQVRPAAYPAVLLATFGQDTRVDPMHARKMCAALQHASTGDQPAILRHEPDTGHGARTVDRMLDLATDELAFLAHHAGLGAPQGES